jgi:DNA-binding NtrC family response regulator
MNANALAIASCCSEVFSQTNPSARKILLIDDQTETSLFVALQQEGYEVIRCESPQKAWSVVWTLRPHVIVIHLTNPNRGDISSLQGCGVLAGGVPIIVAAPISGSEVIIKALEKVAAVFPSFPLGPYGIGKILHDLGLSDRVNKKKALATSEK